MQIAWLKLLNIPIHQDSVAPAHGNSFTGMAIGKYFGASSWKCFGFHLRNTILYQFECRWLIELKMKSKHASAAWSGDLWIKQIQINKTPFSTKKLKGATSIQMCDVCIMNWRTKLSTALKDPRHCRCRQALWIFYVHKLRVFLFWSC